MPFEKGRIKTGGKTKGTLNKRHATIVELSERLGVDPFEVLLKFAIEDWSGLGYPARSTTSYTNAGIEFEEYVIKPEMRLKAAAEACQYLHAKRKSVETTVDQALLDTIKSMEGKTDAELLAILNIKK